MNQTSHSFSDASRQVFFWLHFLFILFGVGLLLWSIEHWYALQAGGIEGQSFCNIGTYWNCDRVSLSPYAALFGIPIGFFGVLWFLLVAVAGLVENISRKIWLLLYVPGLLVSVALFAVLSFILQTGCLICFGTYIAVFGAFGTALVLRRWTPMSLGTGTFVFVLLATILALGTYSRSENYKLPYSAEELSRFQSAIPSMPVEEIELESPLQKGDESADIHIVEFSDFACPHCAVAGLQTIPQLLNDPNIRFSFFPYPRDSECHPQMPAHIQPGTCRLSEAALCAQEQGKFWEMHDVIFDYLLKNSRPIPLELAISEAGLDPEALQECFDRGEAQETLKAMIDAAIEAKIQATPTFFINGRRFPGNFPVPIFRMAIEEIRQLDKQ